MAKSLAMVQVLPPQAHQDAKTLIPKEKIMALKFVSKMNPREQEDLLEESRHLGAAILMQGLGGLAMGQHLSHIQELLTPYNAFYKFLRATFGMAPKSAYRYITGFKNAQSAFPESVMKAAMARGINIISDREDRPLGKFTEAVRILPPPRGNPDPERANKYLDDLQDVVKERRKRIAKVHGKDAAKKSEAEAVSADPDVLSKQAYRHLNLLVKRLPGNARSKRNWLEKVVGMMLADLGVSHASFDAVAVPDDFRATRGRPRLVKDEASAASA